MTRTTVRLLLVMAAGAAACSSPDSDWPGAGSLGSGSKDAGPPDASSPDAGSAPSAADAGPYPTLTAHDRAVLAALAPAVLPAPPPDISNGHADDPKAAAFGQSLFFDTGFSGPLFDTGNDGGPGTLGTTGQTGRVGCVSCHDPTHDFVDDRSPDEQISLGAGWGRRRAPSLLDVGQSQLLGWDGRHDTLYNFTVAALESPADVNSSRLYVAEQIIARYAAPYQAIFGTFPGALSSLPPLTAAETGCRASVVFTPDATCTQLVRGAPGDGAEYDHLSYDQQEAVTQVVVNMGKAIGAYERLLTCGPSRFDAWVHGQQDALNASEQRGAQLFAEKCTTCHSGPYLSDNWPHNVGLKPAAVGPVAFVDDNDQGVFEGLTQAIGDPLNSAGKFSDGNDGRLPTSVSPSMNGAFFTPRLRCVSGRPTLSHTGQLTTLTALVQHFNSGGETTGFLGSSEIAPMGLSDTAVSDIASFLASLQGPGPAPPLLVKPQ